MEVRKHQSHIYLFRTGQLGRVATAALATALFVPMFLFGALVAVVTAAAGALVWARLWWARRRVGVPDSGGSGHLTLEGDYQVLASGRTDRNSGETVEVNNGE
jgi:hypothetical protein